MFRSIFQIIYKEHFTKVQKYELGGSWQKLEKSAQRHFIHMIHSIGTLPCQMSGHGRIVKCVIDVGDHTIECAAKPIDHKESIFEAVQEMPIASALPKFYGIKNVDGRNCILIEDLNSGYSSPCVADIKCGRRHYDLEATPEKIKLIKSEQEGSTTETINIRGENIAMRKNGELVYNISKKDAFRFNEEELYFALKDFIPKNLMLEFEKQIRNIIDAYTRMQQEHQYFKIYGASVLITYDGDKEDVIRVKIIDLAHSYLDISKIVPDPDDKEYDDGFLEGLKSLLEVVNK